MRISPSILYDTCYRQYGIGAFNVFNAEQVHGVFRGAKAAGLPVLIQITPVARNYMHTRMLESMISAAALLYPEVNYAIHLDHGTEAHCLDAIESGGYDSIMIDASHESFEDNIRITGAIVQKAHAKGILVEAELGVLAGVEDDLSVDEESARYTHPDEAHEFVKRTGCDSLAVAIGTSHGAYKFSGEASLRLDILERIAASLPNKFPLVLHGASAVPEELVERINQYGGTLKQDAKGVSPQDLNGAIARGVCKINIATDMRLLWCGITREFFANDPDKFDPIISGATYMNELEQFVKQKCEGLRVD